MGQDSNGTRPDHVPSDCQSHLVWVRNEGRLVGIYGPAPDVKRSVSTDWAESLGISPDDNPPAPAKSRLVSPTLPDPMRVLRRLVDDFDHLLDQVPDLSEQTDADRARISALVEVSKILTGARNLLGRSSTTDNLV